jgi:hypothetical protein
MMDNLVKLGQHKQMTVEQDEGKNVVLRTADPNLSFVLSPEEALDLLHWLYAQQDQLIAVTQDKEPTGKLNP